MTSSRRASWRSRLRIRRYDRALLFVVSSALAISAFVQPLSAVGKETANIESVSVSRPFFNPTLNQTIRINLSVSPSGQLSILILDRDGYLVRRLVDRHHVTTGRVGFDWNGRDDLGKVVPDEAYSLKIDLETAVGHAIYFPASAPSEAFEVKANYFDRRRATLSYSLPKPSRVHIQAGCAKLDPKTAKMAGPVLRTLVNREPRPGGAVVDYWDGFDESGTIRVPDLPNFVVGIAGTTLPDNSLLATGNRSVRFVDTVASRGGASLLPPASLGHHHQGLDTLSDTTPELRFVPSKGASLSEDGSWEATSGRLQLKVRLEGPSAAQFSRQPGILYLFVDQKLIWQSAAPPALEAAIPVDRLGEGTHIVAVNWASNYGPAAANAARIRVTERVAVRP